MTKYANEIGSEFWRADYCDKKNEIFPQGTSWFLSGRSALGAIIDCIRERQEFYCVAMPSWCCESMIAPFVKRGIKIIFYSVRAEAGVLTQDFSTVAQADVLFIMDYFGYSHTEPMDFRGPIIRDVTHSIFSGGLEQADFYFGSLRKWSGVYSGGFAIGLARQADYPANLEYIALRKDAMEQKRAFIEDGIGDKSYLGVFAKAEERLSAGEIFCAMEERSAEWMDVALIKSRRRGNAAYLIDELKEVALFQQMDEKACPLFVPILLPQEQRDALRINLIEQKIYCPIHWPLSELHDIGEEERILYRQELSLICDQRYGQEDMERTVKAVKQFLKR